MAAENERGKPVRQDARLGHVWLRDRQLLHFSANRRLPKESLL